MKLDNGNSQENLIDENRRPGGNFTTIEGIMVEALENVKTLKSQVLGNDMVYQRCKIQSDCFKRYFILRTQYCFSIF